VRLKKRFVFVWALVPGLFAGLMGMARGSESTPTNSSISWGTNGPAVFRLEVRDQNPGFTWRFFDHFLPQSLNHLVWTNVLALTNARSPNVWSVRTHPPAWPAKPPMVAWNTNSLIWGMRGMTALSPCWEDEGGNGQAPITALTKRHGYTRGHGMGADGFTKARNGKKIWFVTTDNAVIQMTVKGAVVRSIVGGANADYTIVLFSKDLPDSIKPMRVVAFKDFNTKYPDPRPAPWPLF